MSKGAIKNNNFPTFYMGQNRCPFCMSLEVVKNYLLGIFIANVFFGKLSTMAIFGFFLLQALIYSLSIFTMQDPISVEKVASG
jgi:hypothetical protein